MLITDLGALEESLAISGACLDKNVPAMYDLIRQFMTETNWDNEKKLDSLIKNSASGVVNSIASAGSRFAELYAASKLTPAKVMPLNICSDGRLPRKSLAGCPKFGYCVKWLGGMHIKMLSLN